MTATRPMTGRRLARALVCAALVMGCGPQAGTGTVNPTTGDPVGAGPDPQGVTEGEGMAELSNRLDALVGRERNLRPAAAADAGKCEELCELATSICSVQAKLCDLADDHPDDGTYQGLCREARNECREAQESCVRCVEANSTQSLPPE